jgi:Uma2 family endonuclease
MAVMSTVLEYPDTELAETDYHAFNHAVWEKLVADPALAALDFRIETDRFGQMIMSPPPAPSHGSRQTRIGYHLRSLNPTGEVISECPISTSDGVKAADVAWCSPEIWSRYRHRVCFLECPEICVEVWSPTNTRGELEAKKRLYFEAGAKEVWFCDGKGQMSFFLGPDAEAVERSALLPEFPVSVTA